MKTKYLLQFMLVILAFTSCEKFKSGDAYLNSVILEKDNNVNFLKDIEIDHGLGPYSAMLIPYNADFTKLVPTINFDGKSISPKSGEAADFSESMKFTITAENNSKSVVDIKMIKTCSYIFDSNGGSYIEPIAVIQGSNIFPGPEPILEDYELVEWQTEDGTPWNFGKRKDIYENVYLKAKWQYDTVSEDGKWKVEYENITGDATIIEYVGEDIYEFELLEIPATVNGSKVVGVKGSTYINEKGDKYGLDIFKNNGSYSNRVKKIDLSKAIYMKEIGINAFRHFYEVEELWLPPNIETIGVRALSLSINTTTTIYYPAGTDYQNMDYFKGLDIKINWIEI